MFNFKNIFLAALATVAVLLTPSCESGEPVGTPEEEQPVEINLYFSDLVFKMGIYKSICLTILLEDYVG